MDFLPTRHPVNEHTNFNYEQEIEFFDAVKNGHVKLVEVYLEENPKLLHSMDSNDCTALYHAIKNNHPEVVVLLLKKSTSIKEIDINTLREFMRTYIGRSIFFLKITMNVKELESEDFFEFMNLVKAGSVATVRLLIQINKKLLGMVKVCGWNCLITGVNYASAEMLELFFNEEVDLETRNNLLRCAVENNNVEAVRFLLKKNASTETHDYYGNTLLMLAAKNGMTNIAEVLIQHGANIEARNLEGSNALIAASEKGGTEVVLLLIQYGVNINARHTKNHAPALLHAALEGHIKTVQVLLEKGADATMVNCDLMSAGVLAIRRNHMKIVDIFLEKGMDLDAVDINGNTPIINSLVNNKGKNKFIAYRLLLEMSYEKRILFTKHSQENRLLLTDFYIRARLSFIFLKKILVPFFRYDSERECIFSTLPVELLCYIKTIEVQLQFQKLTDWHQACPDHPKSFICSMKAFELRLQSKNLPDWYQSYAKKYISRLPSKPIFYQEIKPVTDVTPPTVTFIYEPKKNKSSDTIKQDKQPDQNIDSYLNALNHAISNLKLN